MTDPDSNSRPQPQAPKPMPPHPTRKNRGRPRSADLQVYVRLQEDVYDDLQRLRRIWIERCPDANPSVSDTARRAIILGIKRALLEEAALSALMQDEDLVLRLSGDLGLVP